MSKKARRSLFYGLLLLFPFLGGVIVLYAQGWRLDFETFKVQKVGAIYVKSFPERADIHLNGEPIKNKSGILDRGTFIGNLFPKNYTLTLGADGYLDWKEHIAVKPSLVSEIRYGVLIPKTPDAITTSSVENFWIIDQKLLIKNERGELLWADKKLRGNRVIGWTKDFKKILTEDEKNKTYFINDVSTNTPTITNLNLLFKNLGVRSPEFQKVLTDPGNNNNVVFQTFNEIFTLDISTNQIVSSEKSSSTITQFATSPSWFAWMTFDAKSNSSRLTLFNRSAGAKLDDETFAGSAVKLVFRNDNELGVLQNDGSFSIRKITERSADKIASDVKDFSFSSDEDSVATLESNSIEIFSSDSENAYWRFRLPDNDKIERLEWYRDGTHLFVVYPEEIRFLDFNDKALENFPAIASGSSAHYDEQSNKFYFVKNNGLWSLTFPR